MPPLSANEAEPTLALKSRGDVTRYPKEGCQWPHKRTIARQKHTNRSPTYLKKKQTIRRHLVKVI